MEWEDQWTRSDNATVSFLIDQHVQQLFAVRILCSHQPISWVRMSWSHVSRLLCYIILARGFCDRLCLCACLSVSPWAW